MKLWTWLKDKATWIVASIVLAFGIFFAVKYERKKIDDMKKQAKKTLDGVGSTERELGQLEGKDAVLTEMESNVDKDVEAIDKEMSELNRLTKKESANEVADWFNDNYASTPGSSSRN